MKYSSHSFHWWLIAIRHFVKVSYNNCTENCKNFPESNTGNQSTSWPLILMNKADLPISPFIFQLHLLGNAVLTSIQFINRFVLNKVRKIRPKQREDIRDLLTKVKPDVIKQQPLSRYPHHFINRIFRSYWKSFQQLYCLISSIHRLDVKDVW